MIRVCSVLFLFIFGFVCLDANISSKNCQGKRACSNSDISFDVGAAYTYIYPSQDNLALYSNVDPDGPKRLYYPEIDPQSGFDVFGSLGFGRSGVELAFKYSWFSNDNNAYIVQEVPTGTSTRNDHFYHARWPLVSIIGLTRGDGRHIFVKDAAKGAWNNSFQRVDLMLCKLYSGAGVSFNLRPFLGFVAAWDTQEFQVSYGFDMVGDDGSGGETHTLQAIAWDLNQDWFGVGPSIGIAPVYNIWQFEAMDGAFYLSAKGMGALTCSQIDLIAKQYVGTTDPVTDEDPEDAYRDIITQVSPLLDGCLSIGWNGFLFDGLFVKAAIGWEQSIWFAHTHILNPWVNSPGRGNYYMQGLNISLAIGY